MLDDKNKLNNNAELDDDALDEVSGGSLRDVYYTPTVDISDDTRKKAK